MIRNKANNTYELKIEGGKRAKATEYLKTAEDIITIGKETDALYSCYVKVRETALNIIRDIEGCEIYGYMRKPHDYNDFKFCDNDSLITTYDLHKIV